MTGVEWAVLQAYARILPLGAERFTVRFMALTERPKRMGAALVMAADLGYLKGGQLTAAGEAMACDYLHGHEINSVDEAALYLHVHRLTATTVQRVEAGGAWPLP